MKILKIVLYIVGGLLALWMLLGLFAKKDYHIERVAEIDAPREIVHEQVSFFKNFINWSPWHVYDPNMKTEIRGTDGQPGAVYAWSGNDKVGTGTQTLKSVKPDRVDFEIDFGWTPSPAYFILEEKGKKTQITWAMDMRVAFPWNAFAMLTDVNAFVGKDFDNGLLNIKKVCEQIAHPKWRGYEVAEAEFPLTYYAGVRQVVTFDSMQKFFEENFSKSIEGATKGGAKMTGPPCGFYWTWDTIAQKTDMAAVIPLDKQVKVGGGVQIFSIGGQQARVIEYFGAYDKIGEAHYAMDDYIAEKKLQFIPPAIEEYVTDPTTEPDTSKWLTKVIYFVAPKADSTTVEKKK